MKIALISFDGYVSLGIRYISAKLKQAGYETKLVFLACSGEETYSKKVLDSFREICCDSDIVGFSSMVHSFRQTVQVATALKDSSAAKVWGGPFPTTCPEICIKLVDGVCIGEGEEAMLELVDKLAQGNDFRNTKNFLFKYKDKIITNPVRPLIEALDSLPFPDYDLDSQFVLENNRIVPMREKHFLGMDSRFYGFTFFNTRGCPYSCTYCVNSAIKEIYPRQSIIRKNSIPYVIKQMKFVKEKFSRVRRLRIDDDTFFVRSLEEMKLFSEAYKKEINLPFECNSDPLTINDEKMRLLVDCGLKHVCLGIQSGSERISQGVFNRPFTKERSLNAAKIINKYSDKVEVTYDFIIANPFEKKEDILQTLDFIQQLPKPFYLSMNCMAFFPGSKIYERALRENLKHKNLVFNKKGLGTFFGDIGSINLFTKNKYLNIIVLLTHGKVISFQYGKISRKLFNFLMNKSMIDIFNDRLGFVIYVFIIFLRLLALVGKLIPKKTKIFIEKLALKRI